MISTNDGYFMIEPYDKSNNKYRIYNLNEVSSKIECQVKDLVQEEYPALIDKKSFNNFPYGSQLRNYRMAVATTGEFTQAYGNSDLALAEAVNMVNLITLIYENELAVTFTLISETTNKSLIFTNPSTDPFNGAGGGASQAGYNILNSNGSLTYSKYDIGHMFGLQTSGASGTAGGTPCNNSSKAQGGSAWEYNPNPNADKGWIAKLIAHEIGHQFGASHSYNGVGGSAGSPTFCTDNWSSIGAVEPGAGISTMSYYSNCSIPNQIYTPSILGLRLFHTNSLDQMLTKINNTSTCFTTIPTSNIPPTANAGLDISIPKSTPFKLKGVATDPNDTDLLYAWDETDIATANDKGAMGYNLAGVGGYTAVNSTTAPLFRMEPLKTPERYFPKMEFVVNNANIPPDIAAEALSQIARTIKMRFTVRDNNVQAGGTDSDEMVITVTNDGPLHVSYPNAPGLNVTANSTMNVMWDVNNTNNIKNQVNIMLSLDGGYTYPITLASNTPNNGSKDVIIPNVPSTATARIKVVAVLNNNAEFFDISDNNFEISSSCAAYYSYAYPANSITATMGSTQANLNMAAPQASNPEISSFQNVFNAANLPSNNVIVFENLNTATPHFLNSKPGMITKFRVTESGNYTLTKTNGYMLMNIHSDSSFNTTNFLSSNGIFTSGTSASSYDSTRSAFLTSGTDYYLFLVGASTGNTHTITVNGPGKIYTESAPTAGYNYTYVAINNNNQIVAVSPTANFTMLPVGVYTVQGLSYNSSINPNTFINYTLSDIITLGNCINISKTIRNLTITQSQTLSISEDIIKDNIGIYPNPVEDDLNVITNEKLTNYEIIDFSGRIIRKGSVIENKVNVRSLTTSNYIIRFYKGPLFIYQTKFIKR